MNLSNGEKHKGVHKQFVSRDLFDQVQEQVRFKDSPKGHHNFALTGLLKCAECGGAITAEEHIKNYRTTRGRVRYVYYRCTKKRKCSQPFIPESKLVDQLLFQFSEIALSAAWAKQWLVWAEEEHCKDRQNCEKLSLEPGARIKQVEAKASRLLDLYLGHKLEEGIYKQKQNELFVEKSRLESQLEEIKRSGSHWLEPLKEFIDCAQEGQKIARKENTNSKIKDFAKKVGSNYLLDRGRVITEFKTPFESLRAAARARANLAAPHKNSNGVEGIGIEPMTFAMSMQCSNQLS